MTKRRKTRTPRKPRQPRFSGITVSPPQPVQTLQQLVEADLMLAESAAKLSAAVRAAQTRTPNPDLPPLGDGPRRTLLVEVQVPVDWEKRLDMQWVLEREIVADRWSWNWPASKVEHTIRWPATAWDHVKEVLFPAWWKARWPVQYREQKWTEEVPDETTITSVRLQVGDLVSLDPSRGQIVGVAIASTE